MLEEAKNGAAEQQQSQAVEPIEQETIVFHEQTIIAVRLADGRICVVLRWVCDSLKLQAGGQVRKIERTAATASELVRVRVQTKGGRQTMPALTLRGFSPWILSINPGEVTDTDPAEQERIRALIVAYQEEAKDVLDKHFMTRQRPSLPEASTALVVREQPAEQQGLVKPQEPAPEASDEELSSYYEDLTVWAYWKSKHHAQKWRGELDEWRGTFEARMESQEALSSLLPEIIARLGPETINDKQQRQVQTYVRQLSEASGRHPMTIYDNLKTAFDCPRYQELKADEWSQVLNWFQGQIDTAKKQR